MIYEHNAGKSKAFPARVDDIMFTMNRKHAFLTLTLLLLTVLLASATIAQPPVGDLLLYYEHERETPGINAYNPATGETIELPVPIGIEDLRTSGDGRIAYIQDNDVWVLDVLNAPYSPTNISQTPDEEEWMIGWTPNGRLLEFRVDDLLYTYDGNEVLAVDFGNVTRYWNENGWYIATEIVDSVEVSYVWNGQARIDLDLSILPTDVVGRVFRWTPDNHFFITVHYQSREYYEQPIGPTALFYWNGDTVQEVENPSADETIMVGDWSSDGRLTLYTSQDFFDRWYIWDGVSFTPEGAPDTSTFTAINADDDVVWDIEWMPDGRLAIAIQGNPDKDTLLGHPFTCGDVCGPQVVLWDTDSMQHVASREFGSFLLDIFDSDRFAVLDFDGLHVGGVTVYDDNLRSIFQSGVGPYAAPRWSANGNLAFCIRNDLFVWNWQETILLTDLTLSEWLLAPSPAMSCFSG